MGIRPINRAVFLDRDGVVNEAIVRDGKPYPPDTPDHVRIVAGASAALALLRSSASVSLWSRTSRMSRGESKKLL
jgi:histidinol phosphatase-like enzyme